MGIGCEQGASAKPISFILVVGNCKQMFAKRSVVFILQPQQQRQINLNSRLNQQT